MGEAATRVTNRRGLLGLVTTSFCVTRGGTLDECTGLPTLEPVKVFLNQAAAGQFGVIV